MKFIFSMLTILFFYSCGSDNIDLTTEDALPFEPTIIELEDNILYGRVEETPVVAVGQGYIINDGYLVASDGVDVDCPNSLATSWNGGDNFFHLLFYKFEGDFYLVHAFYDTTIEGERKTVSNLVPPECRMLEAGSIQVVEDGDRLIGTFTDEFFYINPEWVGPFEGCEPWISAGVLEASFDVTVVCRR